MWEGESGGWAWTRVRKEVLERDGYVCRLRYPCCTHDATEVHHLDGTGRSRRRALNGDRCISVCHACHHVETEKQKVYARWGRRKRPKPKHPSEVR